MRAATGTVKHVWCLLGAALAVTALAPLHAPAASARDQASAIVIDGSGTGFVDVRFKRAFTVDARQAEISFDGSFGGWFMHRMGEKIDLSDGNARGAYDIAAVAPAAGGADPHRLLIGFGESRLAPGLYRVYLLGDGPTSVRIPVSEQHAARSIWPTTATTARVATVDLHVNEARAVNDSEYLPVRIGRRSMTITTLYFHAEPGATVQNVQTCITEQAEGETCEEGGIAGQVLHAFETYDFSLSFMYAPGVLDPGSYFSFHKADVAGVDRVVGAYLKLRLRGI